MPGTTPTGQLQPPRHCWRWHLILSVHAMHRSAWRAGAHRHAETCEERVMSPQQSTKESQHMPKGKRPASNTWQQQGRSSTMGSVCRSSILMAKQNTLLWEGMKTALMGAPAQLSSSHLTDALPGMKTTGFAETKQINQARSNPQCRSQYR